MIRLALLISLCLPTAHATESEGTEALPLPARQALTAWNFKFKTYEPSNFTSEVRGLFKDSDEEQPMKIEGDFNNDKKTDFILLGAAEKQQFAVALVSKKDGFKSVVLRQWSRIDGETSSNYLAKVKPGEIPGRSQKHDMVQIETFEGSTELYEIKDYKAVKLSK